ncbi:hypothetical protein HID58_031670 [Brassica napus]|uniref:DUF3700 domain-containing protein n=1 Tax=Brassica napus TaxID=3708 RepID=A0ABQ8BU44_BRANA|nr:hypothetical protein HID58_031670 [Brassica napus]
MTRYKWLGKFGGGGDTLVAMTKKKTPQILKIDTALKLWVANMLTPAEDDPIEAQQEARPLRSFGAKDEIFCLFQGSLDNLGSLKQQYGLAKNANEAISLTRLSVTELLTRLTTLCHT